MAGLEGAWLGKTHIIRRIGGGGMGDVYLAEQPELRRQVAIKILHGASTAASQEEQRKVIQQLIIEARAVATLKHPHIIPIYDFGEQNGILYLVMEYMPFGSLADFLAYAPMQRYRLPLPPPLVADLINQVAGALQFAHDHQFVHLDVKPQNLLLKIQPRSPMPPGGAGPNVIPSGEVPVQFQVILADFGLARFITSTSAQSGANGTPLYTAPEQYQGHRVPSADQYALACVAYLLLTGEPVFKGTFPELYQQHLSVVPRPASSVNPQLPPTVSGVLARALIKDPAQRFPRIQDFASALIQAVGAPNQWPVYSLPATLFNTPAATSQPPVSAAGSQPINRPQIAMPPQQTPGWASPAISQPSIPPGVSPYAQSGAPAAPQPIGPAFSPGPEWTQTSQPGAGWEDAPTFISSQPFPGGGTSSSLTPTTAGGISFPPLPGTEMGDDYPPTMSTIPGPPPRYREPDAPPAPLPPSAQKFSTQRRNLFQRLSLWQRLLFASLALVIIAGASATVLLILLRPPSSNANQIQVTAQTITKFGSPENVTNLPALKSPPQAEAQIFTRLRTPTQPTAPRANSNLPAIPTNTSARDATSNYQSNLPAPKQGGPSKGWISNGLALAHQSTYPLLAMEPTLLRSSMAECCSSLPPPPSVSASPISSSSL